MTHKELRFKYRKKMDALGITGGIGSPGISSPIEINALISVPVSYISSQIMPTTPVLTGILMRQRMMEERERNKRKKKKTLISILAAMM